MEDFPLTPEVTEHLGNQALGISKNPLGVLILPPINLNLGKKIVWSYTLRLNKIAVNVHMKCIYNFII